MFLLILYVCDVVRVFLQFTFHNVSINSPAGLSNVNSTDHLHSTMFLLIHCGGFVSYILQKHLHSTMFLLIQKQDKDLHI